MRASNINLNEKFSYTPGSQNKYHEAKVWLHDNRLLGKEARKYISGVIKWLQITYPESFRGTNPKPLRLWVNEPHIRGGFLLPGYNEQWFVPLPKRSESRKGYEARFRAWLNLFLAYNICQDPGNEYPDGTVCWYLPTHYTAEDGYED